MSNRKEEILYENEITERSLYFERAKEAMSIFAKEVSIEYIMWVIKTFTTDEGRLPLSGNVHLGGLTIFIDHVEYPFSHTYELFLKSKQ